MEARLEVRGNMTRYPLTATPDTAVADALRVMNDYRIRHLPVTDERGVVGVVSARDLGSVIPFLDTADPDDLVLGRFMVRDPYVARLDTPLSEVTFSMTAGKYGCAIVLNGEDEVCGIFTTTDALRLLTALLKDREAESLETKRMAEYEYMDDWIAWDSSSGE